MKKMEKNGENHEGIPVKNIDVWDEMCYAKQA